MSAKIAPSSKSIKERKLAERQRKQLIERLVWGAIGVVFLAALAYVGWIVFGPKPGQSIPTQGQQHIQLGDPHAAYNSDPPTSGPHAAPVAAGFYDEAPPDENLVHNLEHGYVIIWYNCSSLTEAGCQSLKTQIRGVMDRAGPASLFSDARKLIAVPRPKMDTLLALTSWGRLLKLETFGEAVMSDFIDKLRNQAPEGNVP